MRARLRSFLSDSLFKASSGLFVAFLVSNLFSYGFQVVMGRLLSAKEYGFLNSLMAIFVVLSVPISTLLMVVARKTAAYAAKKDFTGIRGLFRLAHQRILFGGLLGLIVFMLGARHVADYLHSPTLMPIILLGLCTYTALAVPINTALLQGLQDYKWMGIVSGLGGPVKFMLCVILVLAGLGVNGVLLGLILASIASWLLAYFSIRRHLLRGQPGADTVHQLSLAHMLPVFLANLAFTVITQTDMILVARFFPAQDAGMYAAAAILGRSVMYIPGVFVQALFPMVSEHHALNLDSRHLLAKALAATAALSGFGAALFFLFPRWIIQVLFNARYLEAAPVLKYFGLAMLPMGLLLVLMNYSIAKGERFFSYVMILGAFLEILLIYRFHDSLLDVVFILMSLGLSMVMLGLLGRNSVAVSASQEARC